MVRAVEPRRRAGLQPPQRKAGALERGRQADRRRLADPARWPVLLAEMDQAAQEGAGGDDDGAGRKLAAVGQANAGDAAIRERPARPPRLRSTSRLAVAAIARLHRRGIELAIGLGARPAHRRTLASVEHPKLDAAGIGDPAHQPVQRIDLADQVALAEPADRWIAGHRADGREPVRHQRGPRTHARGRGRGLAAGVAAADDDNVEGCLDDSWLAIMAGLL